jgi:sec-independent protein translocase protein TatC
MGFLDHLEELRRRIIRSCIAIVLGMIVAAIFIDPITTFILAPTLRALPPGTELVFIRPGENFGFYMDVALIAGSLLAAPFVMYQVWRFIAPALYANEKRFAIPFVALATFGALGGALFGHYVMFPAMMEFFGTFHPKSIRFMPSIESTFELYKNLMLGMIVVFQMPTVALFLARMRLVTARFLWRHFKYAILIIFIAAAVLTPSPDPWDQIIFATPMIVLYVASIGIAWIAAPRDEKARPGSSAGLRLVFAATVIDQARRRPTSRPR